MFKLCILVMFFLIVLPSTSQAKSDIESAGDIVQLAIPTIAYTTTFTYFRFRSDVSRYYRQR